MTVFVAGKHIPQVASFSPLARVALSCVDGGLPWLEWAASTPSGTYEFADETAFVANVQQGLHASPLTLLPRLQLLVSPIKLMTLSLPDLTTLAKAEGGDDSAVVAVQLKKVLAHHKLLTQNDLAEGDAFLHQSGVADAALLQSPSLTERIALYDLLQRSEGQNAQDPSLQHEAAAFAVRQGRSAAEFVDYYQTYLHLVAKLDATGATPQRRTELADSALATLLPLLFDTLDSPQTRGLVSPAEAGQAVSAWLARGKLVGFTRLSQGAQQIVQHTGFRNETGEAARHHVARYLDGAKALLANTKPERGEMAQDGSSVRLPIASGDREVELQLADNGLISLRRYSRNPQPDKAATPKPAPAKAAVPTHKERAKWQRPRKVRLKR